ncbi:MAG TPA: hypothetical protein VK631_15190, partial [Solirubrobacteraceae bacterium]|nr:hypothetical protein [Solirubrobacteraceae bacterium]
MHRHPLRPLLLAAVIVCTALGAAPAGAGATPPGTSMIAKDGFGSAANSYSWSMAWFKGKLYVGTGRNQLCVENATVDFYAPGYYKSPPTGFPEVDCPPDRYDMDLRAEIWSFDPATATWTRVYQSPADIPNPRAPGKFVARDLGFRNMIVHRAPDGTESLYVAGVTTDEYIPELAESHPPRILRTTDGTTFEALNGAPGVLRTPFGPQQAMGYRAMASYDGRLFVTAGGGLTGDGVILEVEQPWSESPSFVQVSPETLSVYELETFNGSLYVGAGSFDRGYSVWKTNMESPARFVPVVTDGAGRGTAIVSVISMQVFKDRLYVGASGWAQVYPSSELIRIDRNDDFEVVTGNARWTGGGVLRFPISGLPDGFGNVFNGHFWRQETHGGALYVGTNDWSWAFRNVPVVNLLLGLEFGFDMYGTCDGVYWWPVTRNAFGKGLYNFGARTLASTPAGGFIGSANHAKGTAVWRSLDASPCEPPAAQASGARAAQVADSTASPPQRVIADVQSCGTVVSWEPSPGASRYRVLRSEYGVTRVRAARRPALPNGGVPEVPLAPVLLGGELVDLETKGDATRIGTTQEEFFVDRYARSGTRYAYDVVAVDASGAESPASNTVIVPSERPDATFAQANTAVRRLDGADRTRAVRNLAGARRSWAEGDRGQALARLARSTAAASEADVVQAD